MIFNASRGETLGFFLKGGIMTRLETIPEIKGAVDGGKRVFCGNELYEVVKDGIGQYLIVCHANQYCVGLHGAEGTKYESELNGENFYTK